MMRVIRALLGCSRREAEAMAERNVHRREQALAMQAVKMKVRALESGAARLTQQSIRTQEAASELMARLREDLE